MRGCGRNSDADGTVRMGEGAIVRKRRDSISGSLPMEIAPWSLGFRVFCLA